MEKVVQAEVTEISLLKATIKITNYIQIIMATHIEVKTDVRDMKIKRVVKYFLSAIKVNKGTILQAILAGKIEVHS